MVMFVVGLDSLDHPAPDHRTPAPLPPPVRSKFLSFFPSPAPISLSLWCPFVEFWFVGWETKKCTFGLSGCRVKPRGLWGCRGFTRQPENSKRAQAKLTLAQIGVSVFWPSFSSPKKEQKDEKKNMEVRGPEGLGPRRVGGPKFRAFFPSPATISLF